MDGKGSEREEGTLELYKLNAPSACVKFYCSLLF